jgi:hypothetical protein
MAGIGRTLARTSLVLCALLGAVDSTRAQDSAPATSCTWQDPQLRATELQAAQEVWRTNISRSTTVVHPSKAYAGVWLRDSFWTITAIGDIGLSESALRHFWRKQLPSGQLPTQFTTFINDPQYRPDESTLLFLIWAAWQAQQGGALVPTPVLQRALAYVTQQASTGLYQSPAGSYVSWFDSFRLKRADTLAYNQGLYAVALQAARALGLGVRASQIEQAAAGYRSMADARGGYLRFSRNLAYHDISGLTGEYLSLWLFKRPLLSDAIVRRTLASQPPFEGGFRVVVSAKGHYLSPHTFTVHVFPGDYQNGGSWLLFDYLALATGALHHVPGMAARMRQRLGAEFAAGATFHEYLNTDPSSPLYGQEPSYRDGFSWDTFVTRVDATLATRCAQGA